MIDTRHHWREPLLREGLARWIDRRPDVRWARTLFVLEQLAESSRAATLGLCSLAEAVDHCAHLLARAGCAPLP
jgi:hypothetical protein